MMSPIMKGSIMINQLVNALAARYEAGSQAEYYTACDKLRVLRKMIGMGNYWLLFHPYMKEYVFDEKDILF